MSYFGTDGVRGKANAYPIDPETIMALALASGQFVREKAGEKAKTSSEVHRPRVVIGKDTRVSGYMIEPALTAGFISQGFDVTLVGPLPTPAVAMLTRSLRADLGVMITASHNPYQDNGIKFFDAQGCKLSNLQEQAISAIAAGKRAPLVSPDEMGKATRMEDARGRYIEFVKNTLSKGLRLEELRIVVDAANGAAYKVAPHVFWELGAEVFPIHHEPNGYNINKDCGALHPEAMKNKMAEVGAHIGIAFDGDADRVIIVDEQGKTLDGDCILALIACALKEKKALKNEMVVATVMSNLGFEGYLKKKGIKLLRSKVGDRFVAEMMFDHTVNLGGEQSGHIILSDYTPTGDGLIAALQVLEILVRSQKPLSEIAHPFTPFPQVLESYPFIKNPLEDDVAQKHFKKIEEDLGEKGRLVIRKSGTENLIRVMVEAETSQLVEEKMKNIKYFLQQRNFV